MISAEEAVHLSHPIPENVMEELDKTTREAADRGQRWATYYDWRTVETWYLPKEIKKFLHKAGYKDITITKDTRAFKVEWHW
jgi:hypothetical protein